MMLFDITFIYVFFVPLSCVCCVLSWDCLKGLAPTQQSFYFYFDSI